MFASTPSRRYIELRFGALNFTSCRKRGVQSDQIDDLSLIISDKGYFFYR
jgi:hypothetical protein